MLGVVPGVMGLLQATEAIKLILGLGDPLIGRLLIWDALDATFWRSSCAATRRARRAASTLPAAGPQPRLLLPLRDRGSHPAGAAGAGSRPEGSPRGGFDGR